MVLEQKSSVEVGVAPLPTFTLRGVESFRWHSILNVVGLGATHFYLINVGCHGKNLDFPFAYKWTQIVNTSTSNMKSLSVADWRSGIFMTFFISCYKANEYYVFFFLTQTLFFNFFLTSCLIFEKKNSKGICVYALLTILKKSFLKPGILSLKDGWTPF